MVQIAAILPVPLDCRRTRVWRGEAAYSKCYLVGVQYVGLLITFCCRLRKQRLDDLLFSTFSPANKDPELKSVVTQAIRITPEKAPAVQKVRTCDVRVFFVTRRPGRHS